MTSEVAAFVCPRCAHINSPDLPGGPGFCERCGRVTQAFASAADYPPPDTRALMLQNQDDCLIAIEDGKPVPTRKLAALPPWRASMIAHIAEKAGVSLEDGTAAQVHAEARQVGGAGALGSWWLRPA